MKSASVFYLFEFKRKKKPIGSLICVQIYEPQCTFTIVWPQMHCLETAMSVSESGVITVIVCVLCGALFLMVLTEYKFKLKCTLFLYCWRNTQKGYI